MGVILVLMTIGVSTFPKATELTARLNRFESATKTVYFINEHVLILSRRWRMQI